MQAINKKAILPLLLLLGCAAPATAAGTAASTPNDINVTLYALVGLMLILLFVIGMLAYTLIQLTSVVRDNARKESTNKNAGLIVILLLLLMPASSFAADPVAAAPVITAIDGIPLFDFYFLTGAICLELLVIFFLAINIRVLISIIKGVPEQEKAKVTVIKKSWFWDNFNKATPVEEEKDILMDHNYDGIQELDNSLPPWWKYGFYLTIVVAAIYLYRFHISHDGQSQQEEYMAEMVQGEEDKAAYLAQSANNVDESNVILLTDPASIATGKDLFAKSCVACHLADGGGSVGPNLTDDYWLHGGGIKDIFKTIKYGWEEKGMKSWKDDLSPMQIQEVASFIKSLKGTQPAVPKAPQGDLYVEVASKAVDKSDSTANK